MRTGLVADDQKTPAGAAGLTVPAVDFLQQLGFAEPAVALAVAGVLAALALWLAWRKPTWLLMLALASLALRPELLWGGPEVGVAWGVHRTLIVGALIANAIAFGIRRMPNWPVLALLLMFFFNLILGNRHEAIDPSFMLTALVILALPWVFAQVVLEPGSRQRYAITLALVPLISVLAAGALHLLDIRPLIDPESTGALRLQGAAGIPADLALLAFGGFAVALHESTRTTNRYFTYLSFINFLLVVFSGTRTAIAASVLLFFAYSLLFPPMRERWRHKPVALALGIGALAVAVSLYLPNLELRMFGASDGAIRWSGRDEMWAFYFDEFLRSPVFGRGLGTGFIAYAEHTSFGLPTPHNEYLHFLVIGGIVGCVLFFGAIVLWFRGLIRPARWDDRAFLLALIPALATYAVTENMLILPSALPVFAYLGILRTRSMREIAPDMSAGSSARSGAEPTTRGAAMPDVGQPGTMRASAAPYSVGPAQGSIPAQPRGSDFTRRLKGPGP